MTEVQFDALLKVLDVAEQMRAAQKLFFSGRRDAINEAKRLERELDQSIKTARRELDPQRRLFNG